MITDAMHKRNLANMPATRYRSTVEEILNLCRAPARNREQLQSKLERALGHYRKRNFYLHVSLFRKVDHYRLMFIDPSNDQVLWLDSTTHKLHWFPLYGDGTFPSIL